MNTRTFHLFTACLAILAVAASLSAAELYRWVDERGVCNVSDRPPEGQVKQLGKETYTPDSPQVIERYQREREKKRLAEEARLESIRKANRAQEEARRQAYESERRQAKQAEQTQKERDERASSLESSAKEAAARAGLTGANRAAVERAAAARAERIRSDTDTPMSAEDDAAYHAREAAERERRWHEIQSH